MYNACDAAGVAQRLERWNHNPLVGGSNPSAGTGRVEVLRA